MEISGSNKHISYIINIVTNQAEVHICYYSSLFGSHVLLPCHLKTDPKEQYRIPNGLVDGKILTGNHGFLP